MVRASTAPVGHLNHTPHVILVGGPFARAPDLCPKELLMTARTINFTPPDLDINAPACRSYGPSYWFSAKPAEVSLAIDICRACPARVPCLEYALSLPAQHDYGVWGGMTERERDRLRRRRRRESQRSRIA